MSEALVPRTGTQDHRGGDDEAAVPAAIAAIVGQAEEAATFLKALGHGGRLLILCHLATGEKSVTELETLMSSRQAAVSQQLARLRLEGIVHARREGQQIYYTILDSKAIEVVGLLNRLFCRTDDTG